MSIYVSLIYTWQTCDQWVLLQENYLELYQVLLDISIATSSSAVKFFFGVHKFYPNSTIWFGSTNFCGEVAWNECSMFLMIRQIHKSHLVLKHSHHAQKISILAKLHKISPKTSLHQAQQFVEQTNLWTLFINKAPKSIVSTWLSQSLKHWST